MTVSEREHLEIRELQPDEELPWDLLLLADPARDLVLKYLKESVVFVAQLGGRVVGEYVLTPAEADQWELMNIAVSPDLQGKGIGQRLVESAIHEARTRGARQLLVGTRNSSFLQLAFYQRCGFRIVGVVPDFFVEHYEEEIIENGIRCVDMVRLALTL